MEDPDFVAGLRAVPSTASGSHVTWSATDLSGVRPDGSGVSIVLDDESDPLLLVFLTTRCDGCDTFWAGLADGGDPALARVRTVVVAKGPDEVDTDQVRALAAPLVGTGVDVVLGAKAWTDYRVTGYPFLVLVDPASRRILAETVGFRWSDVAATVDAGLGPN